MPVRSILIDLNDLVLVLMIFFLTIYDRGSNNAYQDRHIARAVVSVSNVERRVDFRSQAISHFLSPLKPCLTITEVDHSETFSTAKYLITTRP